MSHSGEEIIRKEFIRLMRFYFRKFKDSKNLKYWSWDYYCYGILKGVYQKRFLKNVPYD